MDSFSPIDQIIKDRKTLKVLGDINSPLTEPSTISSETISELLSLAAYAPFHYPCDKEHQTSLTSIVPWRFYTLNQKSCRGLLSYIKENDINAGKIANMLAAADYLIISTWLPSDVEGYNTYEKENFPFKGTIKNMEHIAACSASIQNILLGATSREIHNYWSSGGVLREKQIRNLLNVPLNELLLGGIFLFPKGIYKHEIETKEGALRNFGKEIKTFHKEINL